MLFIRGWQRKKRRILDDTVDHDLIDGRGEYRAQIYSSDYVEGSPLFVNPSRVDFHLEEDSPAIDSDPSMDAPRDDFDGNPRPQGAGYDSGAFEFMGTGADNEGGH